MAKLPSLPPGLNPGLRRFLSRVREAFDGNNPVVTQQDLVSSGSHTRTTSGTLTPTTPLVAADCSTPPAPQNLSANGAMTSILLTWQGVNYGSRGCHSHTEIYRADTNNFSQATLIGVSNGTTFADAVGSSYTGYYWVRFVNANNTRGPLNATNGTVGETAPDVPYLLSQLEGALSRSQLDADLRSNIDIIDWLPGVVGDLGDEVGFLPSLLATVGDEAATNTLEALLRITEENRTRATAVAAESQFRIEGLAAEASARADGLLAEAVARNSAIIEAVSEEAALRGAAIASETQARQLADGAIAEDVLALETTVNNETTGVNATSNALGLLTGRVVDAEGTISAHTGSLTSLQAQLNSLVLVPFDENNVYVVGDLFSHSGIVYRVIATQDTPNATPPNETYYEVQADYATVADMVTAHASTLSGLTTVVYHEETGVSVLGDEITKLKSTVNNETTGVSATSTALGLLTSRVETNEGDITSQAGSLTALKAHVNTLDAIPFDVGVEYPVGELFKHGDMVYRVIATQDTPNATPPNATYYVEVPDHVAMADTVSANSSAVGGLTNSVSLLGDVLSSQANSLTALKAHVNTLGVPAFDATTDYFVGDLFLYVDMVYRVTATQGANVTPPNTTYYEALPDYETPEQIAAFYLFTDYLVGDMFSYDGVVYRVTTTQDTQGTVNATPPNAAYYETVPDYESLSDLVAGNASAVDTLNSDVEIINGKVVSNASAITTLAAGDAQAARDMESLLAQFASDMRIKQSVALAHEQLTVGVTEAREAFAEASTTLAAAIDSNKALIVEEQIARAASGEALAEQINGLSARADTADGAIEGQANQFSHMKTHVDTLAVALFDADFEYPAGELFKHDDMVYRVIATQTPPNATPPNATYYVAVPDHETLEDTVTSIAQIEGGLAAWASAADGAIEGQATQFSRMKTRVDAISVPAFDADAEYPVGELFLHADMVYRVIATQTPPNAAPPNATYYVEVPDHETLEDTVTSIAQIEGGLAAWASAADGAIEGQATQFSRMKTHVYAISVPAFDADVEYPVGELFKYGYDHIYRVIATQTPPNATPPNANYYVEVLDHETLEDTVTAIASDYSILNSTVGGHSTSIEEHTQSIDGVKGQYTVKIDNNGRVAGYGLASMPVDGVPTAEFEVIADRFAIAPVDDAGNEVGLFDANAAYAVNDLFRVETEEDVDPLGIPPYDPQTRYIVGDLFYGAGEVWEVTAPANPETGQPVSSIPATRTVSTTYAVVKEQTPPNVAPPNEEYYKWMPSSPFFHLTVPTTINGVEIPAGTYMRSVFIHDASITKAKIGEASIDWSHIIELHADDITFGTLDGTLIGSGTVSANTLTSGTISADTNITVGPQGQLVLSGDGTITSYGTGVKTTLSSGNVTTSVSVGGLDYPYQSLTNVEVGWCDNNTYKVLDGYFLREPTVHVSPLNLSIYKADNREQDQALHCEVVDVRRYAPGGVEQPYSWEFKAVAQLVLSGNNVTETVNTVTPDADANGVWNSEQRTTVANTTNISVTTTANSVRGTGTASWYYFRSVKARIAYRLTSSGTWSYTSWVHKNMGGYLTTQLQFTLSTPTLPSGTYTFFVEYEAYDTDGSSWYSGEQNYQDTTYSMPLVSSSVEAHARLGTTLDTAEFNLGTPPGSGSIVSLTVSLDRRLQGGADTLSSAQGRIYVSSLGSSSGSIDYNTAGSNSSYDVSGMRSKTFTGSNIPFNGRLTAWAYINAHTALSASARTTIYSASATLTRRVYFTNSTAQINSSTLVGYNLVLSAAQELATGTLNYIAVGS